MDRYLQLLEKIKKFNEDRDWKQYHTASNLAKSISIEANELLECFQWSDTDFVLKDVEEEIADVFAYLIDICEVLDLDLLEITDKKMDKNALKYPIEKAKGNSTKYNKL